MIGRRTLLKQTTAASAAVALLAPSAIARQAVPLQPNAHPFDRFMAASKHVTGYSDLSPDTGYRLFLALENVKWRDDILKVENPKNLTPPARRKLLEIWYLGVVETPNGPLPAAYEDALMFRPLEGIVPTRSYCPGEQFFWAKPPSGHPGYEPYSEEDI